MAKTGEDNDGIGELKTPFLKNLISAFDMALVGHKLFVANTDIVGSNSDHAENGITEETNCAAILKVDSGRGKTSVFGSGLRNPVRMDLEPQTGAIWTVPN